MSTRAFKEWVRHTQKYSSFRGQLVYEKRIVLVLDSEIRPDIVGKWDLQKREYRGMAT
jgi:hypothetical protein